MIELTIPRPISFREVTAVVRVFLNTQYTNPQKPDLISIGLSSEIGHSAYFEMLDGWDRSSCSDFVSTNTLPALGFDKAKEVTREMSSLLIRQWLIETFNETIRAQTGSAKLPSHVKKIVEVISLSSLDLELLVGLPDFFDNVVACPFKVRYVSVAMLPIHSQQPASVLYGINRFFDADTELLARHHALNGALALGYSIKLAEMSTAQELYAQG